MARARIAAAAGLRSYPTTSAPERGSVAIFRDVLHTKRSPQVGDHAWGQIEIEGLGTFRDVKLWPGGGREWDWEETGTRHDPGIQPEDVAELLDANPEVVVLSKGRELRLKTCQETIQLLQQAGVRVVREETSVAIDQYNRLAQNSRRVAALIHTTC